MLSRFTHKPVDHPLGFLVAISGMLMQLMSYGIDNSYSIFSEDMHNDSTLGNPPITLISLGNSVSLGLAPAFGVIAGILVDYVPPRIMMGISTLLLFSGLWISSLFATNITTVTFTYCLLASISSACMLSPGATATSTWFKRYQGLAMGINFCGGGLGSAIIPPILGKWVVLYGWRKTFRLMSAFCIIGVVATLLSAKRHPDSPVSETNMENNNAEPQSREDENNDNHKKEEGGSSDEVNLSEQHRSTERNLHVDKLTPRELFFSLFSWDFMGNFMCWVIFSWAFFSLIYSAMPYISSMGKPGTVYAQEERIPIDLAATLFVFYGICQIVGSIFIGWMATITTDEFAYIICAIIGGIGCGFFAFGRTYITFAILFCIIGFCMAGMFAVMPALIAKRLYGPNLGFYMGSVFLAGIVGGFSAPPIQAELQQRNQGNYTYVCLFMSVCMLTAGGICYMTMWEHKKIQILTLVKGK